MAGFLSLYNTPVRIDVADGYWIDVKTSLSTEDYEAAQRALLGKMSLVSGGELHSEPDTIAYQSEIVYRAIIDWNLTDENDQPLPLEPKDQKFLSIGRLPQAVFLSVFQKVSEENEPRSKEEELPFRSGSPGSLNGDGQSGAPLASKVSD